MKILDAKMDDVRAVAADVDAVITANVGCMLQLRTGMEKNGLNLRSSTSSNSHRFRQTQSGDALSAHQYR